MTSNRLQGLPARVVIAAALLLISLPAAAQWTGRGEAGIAIASGNTETKTANAKLALVHKSDAWENTLRLAGLYVRNRGVTTARRWEVGAQTRYNFGEDTFTFGSGRYERDSFSGFDYQGAFSAGLGHQFVDSSTTKFSGQIGTGFKFAETIATPEAPAEKDTTIAGVGALDFSHQLTDTTTVYNRLSAEYTADNTFLQNEVGIQVKVWNRVALSLAYSVRHNSNPPEAFRKTDTLSTVNLVYEVK